MNSSGRPLFDCKRHVRSQHATVIAGKFTMSEKREDLTMGRRAELGCKKPMYRHGRH
jgi:hypothetical protein